VVSDDATQRHELSGLLRGWRMTPMEADHAPMAIALLERLHEEASPVPLMLVTNRAAVQDGFLLAFRVRNHPMLSETLVMMLASEGRPGDAIACRENGIAAYLRYPLGDKQLNDAIVAVTGASNVHTVSEIFSRTSMANSGFSLVSAAAQTVVISSPSTSLSASSMSTMSMAFTDVADSVKSGASGRRFGISVGAGVASGVKSGSGVGS
jgi:CheY-like chemotaxis protein